jgi:FkbM family methyltransferase
MKKNPVSPLRQLWRQAQAIPGVGAVRYWLYDAISEREYDVDAVGSRMLLNPSIGAQKGYLRGGAEPYVIETIRRLCAPGDTFIDVGAYVGFVTLAAAAAVGPRGRVVAIEPVLENAARIARQLEINGIEHVAIETVAISDSSGDAFIMVDRDPAARGPDAASSLSRASSRGGTRRLIRTMTLDALCRLQGYGPKLIKVDVEGHEFAVLRGMVGLFSQGSVSAIVELNSPEEVSGLTAFTNVHGLSVVELGRAGHGLHFLLSPKGTAC